MDKTTNKTTNDMHKTNKRMSNTNETINTMNKINKQNK